MNLSIKLGTLLVYACAVATMASAPTPSAAASENNAAAVNLVPLPQSVQTQPGELRLSGAVKLEADPAAPNAQRALQEALAGWGIATDEAATTRIR